MLALLTKRLKAAHPIAALRILWDFPAVDIHQSSSTPAIQPGFYLRTNHHAGISSKNITLITNAIPAFHHDYISDTTKHVLLTDLHASYSWQHSSEVIIHTRYHRDLLGVHPQTIRNSDRCKQSPEVLSALTKLNLKIFANSDSLLLP